MCIESIIEQTLSPSSICDQVSKNSAEKIAKIHEALGIDVFFDKHRLKAGYIYSEEISRFIQTADTFVLCWSENAANSDYVEKERQEALALAYPQRKPREQARLRIHPFNIEPHAVPPADMIEHYHFEEIQKNHGFISVPIHQHRLHLLQV